MSCCVCGGELRNGFNYFCRGCYRETHKQLPITTSDLNRYLESSVGKEVRVYNGWNFKMIHKTLAQTHPSLDKLAVLLEKVLFFKLALCRDLDLKASLATCSNDYPIASNRLTCTYCGRLNREPIQ